MIASGDPLNFILACVWSSLLLGSLWLTWYAYVRWRQRPDDSLSHRIAVAASVQPPVVAFALGVVVGFAAGLVLGIFTGNFVWPVELSG